VEREGSRGVSEWLFAWQTLVGAIIGSVGALLVAELVASSARWRELHVAAGQVLWELQRYVAEGDAFAEVLMLDRDPFSKESRVAMSIVHLRPRLSTLWQSAAARIVGMDPYLDQLLGQCLILTDDAERGLERACLVHDRILVQGATAHTAEELFGMVADGAANVSDAVAIMRLATRRLQARSRTSFPTLRALWYDIRWRLKLDRPPRSDELPQARVKVFQRGEPGHGGSGKV
jgi:hypothetical protein